MLQNKINKDFGAAQEKFPKKTIAHHNKKNNKKTDIVQDNINKKIMEHHKTNF